jgi:hypothetical protein
MFKQFLVIYCSRCSEDMLVLLSVNISLYILNDLSTSTVVIQAYFMSAVIVGVMLDGSSPSVLPLRIADNYFNFDNQCFLLSIEILLF